MDKNFIVRIPILIILLSGCALPVTIKPPPADVTIVELCIINNPKILMDGFLPELKSQIESYGIPTFIYTEYDPSGCRYWLEYTANWHWDFVMYMIYAELKLYDHTTLIGSAVFDNTGFGPRHYGSAAGKLKALTDPLFTPRGDEIISITHFD